MQCRTLVPTDAFIVDYPHGTITIVATTWDADAAFTATYTLDTRRLNIDPKMGVTRLDRIEAASGSSRRAVTITGYQDYGDYILFDGESAPRGGDVYVYYQAPHSVPTNSARGSYPEYLDDAVLIGISGYALKMRARAIQQDIADSSEEMIEEIKRPLRCRC